MRCAECGRAIRKPAGMIFGGAPVGPKCWAKLKGKTARIRTRRVKVADGQALLFGVE